MRFQLSPFLCVEHNLNVWEVFCSNIAQIISLIQIYIRLYNFTLLIDGDPTAWPDKSPQMSGSFTRAHNHQNTIITPISVVTFLSVYTNVHMNPF